MTATSAMLTNAYATRKTDTLRSRNSRAKGATYSACIRGKKWEPIGNVASTKPNSSARNMSQPPGRNVPSSENRKIARTGMTRWKIGRKEGERSPDLREGQCEGHPCNDPGRRADRQFGRLDPAGRGGHSKGIEQAFTTKIATQEEEAKAAICTEVNRDLTPDPHVKLDKCKPGRSRLNSGARCRKSRSPVST